MSKKRIYILFILLVVVIICIWVNFNFSKINVKYISKKYSIDIVSSSLSGKDYAYWGYDTATGDLKYVMSIYRKGFFVVDGREGISYEKAKELSDIKDSNIFYISLVVLNSFNENKSIIDYMYWVVEYDDSSINYIKFTDGVEGNPFSD